MTKPMSPEIKALRAIRRALDTLPYLETRRRVLEYTVAKETNRSWVTLPPTQYPGETPDPAPRV